MFSMPSHHLSTVLQIFHHVNTPDYFRPKPRRNTHSLRHKKPNALVQVSIVA
jgi:hypothetical protein